jgi:tetraacyldisaccharide 4'-kinase
VNRRFRDRLERWLEALWYRRAPKAWWYLLFAPLGLASSVTWLAAGWRWGRPFRHRVAIPVISVGNLCIGGSGKTQVVLYLCERARQAGLRPAALLRGYRGREVGPIEVPSSGSADRFGDEAILLARRCPEARVVVARDRAAGAELAARLGANWIVLDDGLQQRALEPLRSVVVLAAESPLGNGHLLPLGPLRDLPSRLGPDAAIWIHVEGSAEAPARAVFRSRTIPLGLVPADQPAATPRAFARMRIAAFAGIARPERFLKTLERAGAALTAQWLLGDHRRFDWDELVSAADRGLALGAEAMVCTEKDAVRLPANLGALALPIFALRVGIQLDLGESEISRLLSG